LPESLKDENKLRIKIESSLSKHSNTPTWRFLEKLENHPTMIIIISMCV
jgi:hypothetical protein